MSHSRLSVRVCAGGLSRVGNVTSVQCLRSSCGEVCVGVCASAGERAITMMLLQEYANTESLTFDICI